MRIKLAAREKRKGGCPKPLWSEYKGKNEKKRLPTRNMTSRSSVGSDSVTPCAVWRGKGLSDRKSITGSAEPQEPVLTPSPTLWGGANMSGPGKGTHEESLHGLETYGVPAPWTTNS